jgi:uncharacterized protein (TIGR01777 family)
MANAKPYRVLMSGSSGLIGTALVRPLESSGYEVTRLVRGEPSASKQIAWDPNRPLDPDLVSGFDAVIHLSGESIMGRWTAAKKQKIVESRVLATRNFSEALAKTPQRPRVMISGSAIGFYGNRGDELLREESFSGTGFLPEVCREWEGATQAASAAGIRVAHIRTGIVLSREGGALPKMLLPFRLGIGGKIGGGRQWMSWIGMDDMVGAVQHILKDDSLQGPINMVAPDPVTNGKFTKALASVLSRPAVFTVPAFAVRVAFGEMGEETLLGSQRVEPAQLVASEYIFHQPDLRRALDSILKR